MYTREDTLWLSVKASTLLCSDPAGNFHQGKKSTRAWRRDTRKPRWMIFAQSVGDGSNVGVVPDLGKAVARASTAMTRIRRSFGSWRKLMDQCRGER
jgi:hypothetical protein